MWISTRVTARAVVAAAVLATAGAACGLGGRAIAVGDGAALPRGYVEAFENAGGAAALGRPLEAVTRWGSRACIQPFHGGSAGHAALIQYTCHENLQVFAVTGRVWDAYTSQKDAAERIGYPLGAASTPWGFTLQLFESPAGDITAIASSDAGTFFVRAPLLDAYLQAEKDGESLGPPTSPMRFVAGRAVQTFARGRLDVAGVPT